MTPTGEAAIEAESDWHTQRAFLDLLRRRPELCNANGEGELNIVLREAYLTLAAVLSVRAKRPVTLADSASSKSLPADDAQAAHVSPPLSNKPRSDSLTREEKALALLVGHPEWTDARIANEVGCNRRTLYKWQRYRKARGAMRSGRASAPSGSKSAAGDVEAWDNE